MTVICWEGLPRTGKTLGMTFYGYNNYANRHYDTFANYELMFPFTRLNVFEMLEIPFNDVDRNAKQLMIQEADKIFDSRRSMTDENRLLSSLTGQSGKRNLDILYDTQFFNRIDQTLRRVTEYVVTCSCYVDGNTKLPLAFEQFWQRYDGLYLIPIKKVIIPEPLLRGFYSLYDSYESTKPLRKKGT